MSVHTSLANMPLEVGHDEGNKKFYIQIPESQKGTQSEQALLEYECISPGTFNLYHTLVPPSYRGQGVAKLLAKAALDYVVEKDAKMYLTCSYLEKYVRDNPQPQYTERVLDKSQL